MMRKLTVMLVMLLTGTICLLQVSPVLGQEIWSTLQEYEESTGKKIEKFNESLMLKALVDAGQLPPVEERLPEEPMVIEPVDETGQPGGVLQLYDTWIGGIWPYNMQQLLVMAPDFKSVLPNIVKDYKLSDDGKTLTLSLRRGLKWSDGEPFTADDFLFWYEDVLLDENVGADWARAGATHGGEIWKLEKVNDYTVNYCFAAPFPTIPYVLLQVYGMQSSWGPQGAFLPKHYLKRFHKNYVPEEELQELAVAEGFENWVQLFQNHAACAFSFPTDDLSQPSLNAWVLKEKLPTAWIFERNPYFWKVDTAGNQLPYIDKVIVWGMANQELVVGKALSGEADLSMQTMDNYPLLKQGEEDGNYRVLAWKDTSGSHCLQLNLTCENPVLREIFEDVRFRRALSLAINREEINEVCYFGLGIPSQETVMPDSIFYEEEFARAYAAYDPEEANRLLTEMGLEWDSEHQWRLMPNGNKLSWTFECSREPKLHELVADYWRDIGADVNLKYVDHGIYSQHVEANLIEMGSFPIGRVTDIQFTAEPFWCVPIRTHHESPWCGLYGMWNETGGQEGEEPPAELKRQLDLFSQLREAVDEKEKIRLGKEILRSQAENLWTIGLVTSLPVLVVVKNNLVNIPEVGVSGWDALQFSPYHPSQFLLKP